jgi:hypothetical protein
VQQQNTEIRAVQQYTEVHAVQQYTEVRSFWKKWWLLHKKDLFLVQVETLDCQMF